MYLHDIKLEFGVFSFCGGRKTGELTSENPKMCDPILVTVLKMLQNATPL